ncbi:hypothetical protein IWX46DRAFT_583120 [Phyllosticta citricarpa]|uniref:Uncharacterized protein n=1 Tax=Phyllosticta citricarpa TaxID=55181 RepID=A0ABR1LVA4_9PEZI
MHRVGGRGGALVAAVGVAPQPLLDPDAKVLQLANDGVEAINEPDTAPLLFRADRQLPARQVRELLDDADALFRAGEELSAPSRRQAEDQVRAPELLVSDSTDFAVELLETTEINFNTPGDPLEASAPIGLEILLHPSQPVLKAREIRLVDGTGTEPIHCAVDQAFDAATTKQPRGEAAIFPPSDALIERQVWSVPEPGPGQLWAEIRLLLACPGRFYHLQVWPVGKRRAPIIPCDEIFQALKFPRALGERKTLSGVWTKGRGLEVKDFRGWNRALKCRVVILLSKVDHGGRGQKRKEEKGGDEKLPGSNSNPLF